MIWSLCCCHQEAFAHTSQTLSIERPHSILFLYGEHLACKLFRRCAPIACERWLSFSWKSRVGVRRRWPILQSLEACHVSSRSPLVSHNHRGPLHTFKLQGTLGPTPIRRRRERFALTSCHGPLLCYRCACLVVNVFHCTKFMSRRTTTTAMQGRVLSSLHMDVLKTPSKRSEGKEPRCTPSRAPPLLH